MFCYEPPTLFNGLPADQYREALRVATRFIEAKDKDGKMSLVITGHSLGGGIGQYVSLKTGVKAVLFNAAALGPETVRDIAPQLREGSSCQITHISLRADFVHNSTRNALAGKHYGVEYVVEPAPGTPNIFPLDAPLLPALYLEVAAAHIRPEAPGAFAELRRRVRESRPSSGAWLWRIR